MLTCRTYYHIHEKHSMLKLGNAGNYRTFSTASAACQVLEGSLSVSYLSPSMQALTTASADNVTLTFYMYKHIWTFQGCSQTQISPVAIVVWFSALLAFVFMRSEYLDITTGYESKSWCEDVRQMDLPFLPHLRWPTSCHGYVWLEEHDFFIFLL